MSFNYRDPEYLQRRKTDEYRTRTLEKFMDKLYRRKGLLMQRVTDAKKQKQGADLIHRVDGEIHYIDEKYAINYYDKDLRTFSFELYSKNNYHQQGWFISDNSITTDYCVFWFRATEDFKTITTYDLCYIPKSAIMQFAKDSGLYDGIVEDFLDYWENHKPIKDSWRFSQRGNGKDERRYMKLKNGCKLVQSVGFQEQPINIVIPREELYKLAIHHFHG